MNMTLNDHHETKVSEQGAAPVECIELANNDSKLKSGSSIVESGVLDTCHTPDLEFAAGSGHCCAVSEEDGKGYIVSSEDRLPVACKSTCLLAVHETGLSKCGMNRGGNISSLKTDGGTEEENVRDDGRTVCRSASAMNGDKVSESCVSKCAQSTYGGNADHKDEKNLKLRPRRKSKYLSPPFVEPIKGSKSPGDMSIQHSGSPSLVKCSRKGKQPRKSIAGSANLEAITASSAQLILQLHIVARDYLNPYYTKAFDPAKQFFNSFRASVFRGLSILEQTRTDKGDAQKKNKNQVRKKRKERDMTESDKKAPSNPCDVNLNVASSSPLTVDPLSGNIKPQRKRPRKVDPIVILESGANQIDQIPDLNCISGVPSATLDPLQVTCQGEVKSEPEKKKRMRKKKTTPATSISGIPYPNGNSAKPISIEVCLQDAGPYAFAASTVLNSNPASPPGFCAKGSTPSKPTPPPKLESMERVNNTVIGNNTNNKSSSGMTLDQMKQSLEFMTSMLEKSGDTISPVMRANLEKEIKNLLKKVNPMISPSS